MVDLQYLPPNVTFAVMIYARLTMPTSPCDICRDDAQFLLDDTIHDVIQWIALHVAEVYIPELLCIDRWQ